MTYIWIGAQNHGEPKIHWNDAGDEPVLEIELFEDDGQPSDITLRILGTERLEVAALFRSLADALEA